MYLNSKKIWRERFKNNWSVILILIFKIDLVIAYELDLLGQVILFFANELDLFIKIKDMVILNSPV